MSAARKVTRIGRHLPLARLLLAGELLLVARDHMALLEPGERRRVLELVLRGRGRRRNLTDAEREELAELVAKAQPRRFAGTVAERFSPVPLPRRIVEGPRRRARR